eukprot:scaffold8021_cov336-Prasinococcus_capsulatus_cf.AAC.1
MCCGQCSPRSNWQRCRSSGGGLVRESAPCSPSAPTLASRGSGGGARGGVAASVPWELRRHDGNDAGAARVYKAGSPPGWRWHSDTARGSLFLSLSLRLSTRTDSMC